MFAPPKRIETDVFARLPDRYRRGQTATAWGTAQRPGHVFDSFLEGPSFDRAGNLYVVDIPFGRVFRISPEGTFELVTEYDGEPNGLKIHSDGRIFIADYRHGIMQLEPETGTVTTLIDRRYAERFKGVNDLVLAANGDLYFTDQGQTGLHDPSGRVYRLTAAGRLERLLDNVPSPNGIALSLDEKVLYVAVTRGNCVWRVPLQPDGGTSKVGLFIQLSGGWGGPDGLALDADGGLVVAHAGLGSAWHFSPLGEPLHRIVSCEGLATTNIAFGGPGNRQLFITESESGCVLRAQLPVAGHPMLSHRGAERD
ncbi:SMP-30/gluconolactonase/LRE family protein [Salinisphaera sp. T31B1]|uniref:SMP-30/gluconolactonase/LRE family protein n=1 Tax=Salinisphaera sp. T31B1 TaxID=727963 RepID=UPI00334268A1